MIIDLWVQEFSGPVLKRSMKNNIFWSEIGSGFWEPCGTPPYSIWRYLTVFGIWCWQPKFRQIPGDLTGFELPMFSSFGYICILARFVRINTMDTLEQMVCGLHLLSASCPSEKTFKKKIIWVFRVAKCIQRYLMRSHMVANSWRGSPRVISRYCE